MPLLGWRMRKTITQIFQESGEEVFREMERQTTLGLEGLKDTVIAIGGGLILDPVNLSSLRKHALLVCLWASPQSIYSRIRSQEHRPLLQTGDPLETIMTLLARRAPLYRQTADVLINTEFRSLPEVARHVAHSFLADRFKEPKPESPRE